jgi:hypothetical protein
MSWRGLLPVDGHHRAPVNLGVEAVISRVPPLHRSDGHIDFAVQAFARALRRFIEGIAIRSPDDQDVQVRRGTALLAGITCRPGTENVGIVDSLHAGEFFRKNLWGPNERSNSSVRGPVRGDGAAVTRRAFPTRREATTPAFSARATSRWTDETVEWMREATSLKVHSLPGLSSTSVSRSACSRDRSSGRRGGGSPFGISRKLLRVICKVDQADTKADINPSDGNLHTSSAASG